MNKLFLIEVMKNSKIKNRLNKKESNLELTKKEMVRTVVDINDYFMNKKCN